MEPDSLIIAAGTMIIAAGLFAIGVVVGHGRATTSAFQGCTLQGSFVIDGKVYDCTPRARQ